MSDTTRVPVLVSEVERVLKEHGIKQSVWDYGISSYKAIYMINQRVYLKHSENGFSMAIYKSWIKRETKLVMEDIHQAMIILTEFERNGIPVL